MTQIYTDYDKYDKNKYDNKLIPRKMILAPFVLQITAGFPCSLIKNKSTRRTKETNPVLKSNDDIDLY